MMAVANEVAYRFARRSDAQAIAALHADSWRRHYRDAYSNAFLEADVVPNRLAVWTARLRRNHPNHYTIVAESEDAIIGFAHTLLDDDPEWGALLDNLHVVATLQRHGIGRRLMAASAKIVVKRRPSQSLYLWVLEQNKAAQAFYESLGGACVERGVALPPAGDPSQLNGTPGKLRYAWRDPSILVRDMDHELVVGRLNSIRITRPVRRRDGARRESTD